MKISSYIQSLEGIRVQQGELDTAINELVSGTAVDILQVKLEELEMEASAIENMEVQVAPHVIRLAVADVPQLTVAEVSPLDVNFTLADGTLKDSTTLEKATALFTDFDKSADNTGFLASLDVSAFTGAVDNTFTITRTANGFDVFDKLKTQGLIAIQDAVDTNKYSVVDTNGDEIGLVFTDSGTVPGDNFTVMVFVNPLNVVATSDDDSIVTVNGLEITAVGAGTTNVTVTAGDMSVVKSVTVA